MQRPTLLVLALVLGAPTVLLVSAARGAEFFVDPAAGTATGDGSAANPWQRLDAVIAAGAFGTTIKAGDTVWLRTGYHGALAIKNGNYTPSITIAAAVGQKPALSRATFNATQGWVLAGMSISPSYAPTATVGDMVLVDTSSARVTVKDCDLFSVKDTSAWDATEWINAASSGIFVRGKNVTVSNNRLTNVRFGISVDGTDALIDNNSIVNFSADGLRGLGDNGIFQYNLVKNVYVSGDDGDDNHDDGFQSWSTGADGPGTGVVKGIVLRGNIFINREDPNQKLANTMQGIGCFDGMFDGWVVESNVVITDHWHGISFYGMTNSRIVNNTVIDVDDAQPGPPWIKVTPHKNGTASQNVVVRNNLATDYDLAGTSITDDHNTTLTAATLATFFVKPAAFDLHLLPDAPAVDTGSAEQAATLDVDRIARPQGKAVDLGAYEWHETAVVPADGGAGAAGPAGAGGASGAGGSAGTTTGGSSGAGGSGGCSCDLARSSSTHGVWTLMALAGLWASRRRAQGSRTASFLTAWPSPREHRNRE